MERDKKQDSKTRNKLLQSAREEFMEKGYGKASLRNICQKAGVTTGALYFFFKDKDALFEALTGEIVDVIFKIMQIHFEEEKKLMENGQMFTESVDGSNKDYRDMKEILEQMYLYRDDILLVLTKSEGSKLANIEDKFVTAAEEHYRLVADGMEKAYPRLRVDDHFIHWMAHMQIDAFIYMITHIDSKEEAYKFMKLSVAYMLKGWYGMFEKEGPDK